VFGGPLRVVGYVLWKLKAFKERFGHCNVEVGWKEDPALGSWVSAQRTRWTTGRSTPSVNGYWTSLVLLGLPNAKGSRDMDEVVSRTRTYVREHGNPNVLRTYHNTELASWVWIQRQRRKGTKKRKAKVDLITAEQESLLDKLGFRWMCVRNRGPSDLRS